MEKGWNGNEAPSFSSKLIAKTRNLLKHLTIQPEVFPTALGTIQLEFDNSRKDHMEIEIDESDEAEVFIVKYNGAERLESISSDVKTINKKVRDFYG